MCPPTSATGPTFISECIEEVMRCRAGTTCSRMAPAAAAPPATVIPRRIVTATAAAAMVVTGTVVGSGLAAVQVAYDRDAGVATMVCAIDNLGKGTASAAVQSLNLALGLEENTAITTQGVAP